MPAPRKYVIPPGGLVQRRTMRVITAWRAALVEAQWDEDKLTPNEFVQKTKAITAKYDLYNEFSHLSVRKGLYVSDLLKELCKDAIGYVFQG